jgi:peptidyl-prolyl cis-trans isomerase C
MSCAIKRKDLPRPAEIAVNGVAIPRGEIALEVQHHPAPTAIEAWKAAARALIVRELLLQEAGRLGIAAEPLSDGDGRRELATEAIIRCLLERQVAATPPDERACRRFYVRNRDRFFSDVPFEAVAERIAAYLGKREEQQAAAAYVAGLVAGARIEGFDMALAATPQAPSEGAASGSESRSPGSRIRPR